ncbi:Mitochondrial import inner membrane translocase subunit Tim23 [Acipenser ruthenus]|uniref:Mitochondrial import inner membrane translocase subunit Tim23 n=1 Tax=Acipenser ruthenus TaxID=7906 RepID=A0A444UKT5_ACIRT|nr:Mitochondrial import inner membrane translocase subunit Tim23 [Acipenser ruthenus]
MHHRLDSVEKRVEEVVGQLETEVSILLDAIEAPEWRPLLEAEGPTIDILDNKGAAFGAVNGLRLGLTETRDMAWSKPRNVQILNLVTRQGAAWANTLGSLALLYSAFGVIIEKTRGAEDDLNTVAAGTLTGVLYKSTGGLRGMARGGLMGLALTGLYSLYNNWEHMRGSSHRQSL